LFLLANALCGSIRLLFAVRIQTVLHARCLVRRRCFLLILGYMRTYRARFVDLAEGCIMRIVHANTLCTSLFVAVSAFSVRCVCQYSVLLSLALRVNMLHML